jgi:hypothetical protein
VPHPSFSKRHDGFCLTFAKCLTQEDPLANTQILIAEAYSAFNRRDIDGALALMSGDSEVMPISIPN